MTDDVVPMGMAEGLLLFMAQRCRDVATVRTVDAVEHTATALVCFAAVDLRGTAAEAMDALGALWDVAQYTWHAGRLTRAAARAAGSTSGTAPERRSRARTVSSPPS